MREEALVSFPGFHWSYEVYTNLVRQAINSEKAWDKVEEAYSVCVRERKDI